MQGESGTPPAWPQTQAPGRPPLEGVEDDGVVTVDSIWVPRLQAQVSPAQLVAGDAVPYRGETRVEGGPTCG